MSKNKEIDKVVKIFKKINVVCFLCLYPCQEMIPFEQYNKFKKRYKYKNKAI